jgi:mRNA interferase MazF
VRRGDLYRIPKPRADDPKAFRVFVVVGRQAVIDSRFSTVICAPVFSARHGLASQVPIGIDEGMKHDSAVHCDQLVSLDKQRLTAFMGRLPPPKMRQLDRALIAALDIDIRGLG